MKFLENRIPPPLAAIATALAMWALIPQGSGGDDSAMLRLAIALLLAACGGFLAVSGFRAFGLVQTTIDPIRIEEASALVTTGVYGFTRNPMYLALACFLTAWAIYLASPWAALGPLAFIAFITRFQIIPEERVLAAKFGAEYEAYKEKVRRWV